MITSKKIRNYFLLLGFLLILSFFISLSVGYASFSINDLFKSLIGEADNTILFVLLKIRLPRIIACILGGASLALSGILLQTLTKNPLADSGILGINMGAGLMLSLTISLGETTLVSNFLLLSLLTTLGGIITICIVYSISLNKNYSINPTKLIISGVGVSSLLSGIMVSVITISDKTKMDYIISWLSGKISGGNWTVLTPLTPILLILWGITYSRSHFLNVMSLNEKTTVVLGINLKKERGYTLALSTALAAISIILVGNITFIGLVAGHISRHFLGHNHKLTLSSAMLIGMILVIISDTIGRVFLVGTGVPTGLIISIIGAIYFLYLIKTS